MLFAKPKRAKRLVQWVIFGALLTSALGAAANHFSSVLTWDPDRGKTPPKPADSSWNGHQANWWSTPPSSGDSQGADSGGTIGASDLAGQKSPSNKTPPVDHGVRFKSTIPTLQENSASIGAKPARDVPAFAGPTWMNTAPIATATQPSSNRPGSNSHTGKSSNKTGKGSVWESPFPVTLNTETTASQPAIGPSPKSSGTSQAPGTGPGIPVNRGYQLGSGTLFLNNKPSPGSTPQEPDYEILGLATSSTPQNPNAISEPSELHFSLSAQIDTVPTLSISGSSLELVAVPEPATCAMLLAGGAMLLFGRRRPSPTGRAV